MGGHVFISYSRTDRAYVDKLAARLAEVGVPVWYDFKISAGQRFGTEIQRQIDTCAALVVVLSPESVASEWVAQEIAYARYRGRPVLPLMLRQCDLPIELITTHYEDVTGGRFPSPQFLADLGELSRNARAAARPPGPAPLVWRSGGSRRVRTSGGYAVIDVETTDLSPNRGRVIEIAVVRTDPEGRVIDDWSTLLDPEGPVGPTHVHGITAGDVAQAPRFAEVAAPLVERLAGRVFVAHNAKFDLAFVRAEFERLGYTVPSVPVLCTYAASRYYLPSLNRRRLADCCAGLGIGMESAPSALGDAVATARLLESYLSGRAAAPPDPEHVDLPRRAIEVTWPAIPAAVPPTTATPAPPRVAPLRLAAKPPAAARRPRRGEVATIPAQVSRLAALLDDVPLSLAAGDRAPEATTAYLELLAEVLEDRVITLEEADSLAGLAAIYSLSRDLAAAAHRSLLLALARQALADGKVTRREQEELSTVAKALGFDGGTVSSLLDEAAASVPARRSVPEPRAAAGGGATRADLGAIRSWARQQGLPVGVRGRLPADVLEKYRAAHALA